MTWFIIPPVMKSSYKKIKKLSIQGENPKVTQVVLTTTLAKKGFASILTKILLQIASKVGNVLWAPKISQSLIQKIMLIGIQKGKDTANPQSKIVGYCATLNKEMTKFHSSYDYVN